jgi:hypothetical protein
MAGGKKNVLQTRPDGKECFECAQTGFQIRKRVFFDHEFLKTHGLVSMLGHLSFIDWNSALAYCQKQNRDGKMEENKFYNIMNHIRTLHGLMIGANIYIPQDIKTYPKYMDGSGPKEYIEEYPLVDDQLLNGSQSVEEYKSWLVAKNKDVPKVLTQEQIEKKKHNMNALKTRHTLNFLVEVPASKSEVEEEDRRVAEVEAEEKKLQEEEVPVGGKRKNLTKQKLSAKRRKIKDGFRPVDYIAGETNSANLASKLIGGDQVQLQLTVKTTKNADGEPRTTIHFTNANSGAEKLRFVLPGNL